MIFLASQRKSIDCNKVRYPICQLLLKSTLKKGECHYVYVTWIETLDQDLSQVIRAKVKLPNFDGAIYIYGVGISFP